MENVQNLTTEELLARLEALRIENEALKANKGKKERRKFYASKKGAIGVGPGVVRAFGVVLYLEEWNRLFQLLGIEAPQAFTEFVNANKSQLSLSKPEGFESPFIAELKRRSAAKKAAQNTTPSVQQA
jgi:hypothetical protein